MAWDLLRRAQDNPDRTQRATIHFSTPVLGVLIDAAPLEASDTPLGATPAAWLALATPASLDGRDALTLSSDRRSLSLRFAGADARRIRILTEAP